MATEKANLLALSDDLRCPVVIMGHIRYWKDEAVDKIRKTNVQEAEASFSKSVRYREKRLWRLKRPV
jgi:hypothetical protein